MPYLSLTLKDLQEGLKSAMEERDTKGLVDRYNFWIEKVKYTVKFADWHSSYLNEDLTAISIYRFGHEEMHSGINDRFIHSEQKAKERLDSFFNLQKGLLTHWEKDDNVN